MNYSQLLLPALIVTIGSYNLFKIKRAYQDPRFVEEYIRNSHKALIWRKLFGVEKTINLTKKVFFPIGITVSIVFIVLGAALVVMNLVR